MQKPLTVALLGLTDVNEPLREALRAAGLLLEGDPGASGLVAAVIDLGARDRDELIALARQCYGPLVGVLPQDGAAPLADGLDGFVRAPYAAADLPPLLRALSRARRDRDEMLRQTQDLAALLDVTRTFAASGDTDRLLFEVVEKLAGRLTVERCSLVLVDSQRGTGWVVAASDDAMVRELRIDLSSYPEIREVLQTRKPLVIDDARRHPLLDPVRDAVDKQGISAVAVVPMVSEGDVVGVLFLRAMARSAFAPREIGFLSIVANATAVALRNAQLVGRAQTERSQEVAARVAAEREVHQLRRYEEFFSHVSDGMAVLDEDGRVLSLNPAGCATLGVTMEQARGLPWTELVAPQSAMNAALVWRELQRGGRVLSADLEIQTRDGRRLVLSVSAGPIRSQHGRAILSFRDVTEPRAIEAELRKTKDFLERLIDATVDGIVAADLRGRILLWNKGAERVTGFSAAEVVGKMSVADVYPPGRGADPAAGRGSGGEERRGDSRPSLGGALDRERARDGDGGRVQRSAAPAPRRGRAAGGPGQAGPGGESEGRLRAGRRRGPRAEPAVDEHPGLFRAALPALQGRRSWQGRAGADPPRGRTHGLDRPQDRQDCPLRDDGVRRQPPHRRPGTLLRASSSSRSRRNQGLGKKLYRERGRLGSAGARERAPRVG